MTNTSSPFDGSVSAPSGTKPLQELLDELDKLTPSDSFVPVTSDSEADMTISSSENQ